MGKIAGVLQGFAVFVFELQQVVASFFHDVTGIVLIAVQGIGGNQSVVQVGLLVESARNGEFSLLFVLLATGFFFGDADGYRAPLSCSLRHTVRTWSRTYLPSMARARGRVPS